MPATTHRVKPAPTSTPTPPASPAPLPVFMSPFEAAEYLGVHPKSVRRYVSRGDLVAYRVAGSRLIKIRRDDLDALLQPIPTAG